MTQHGTVKIKQSEYWYYQVTELRGITSFDPLSGYLSLSQTHVYGGYDFSGAPSNW